MHLLIEYLNEKQDYQALLLQVESMPVANRKYKGISSFYEELIACLRLKV